MNLNDILKSEERFRSIKESVNKVYGAQVANVAEYYFLEKLTLRLTQIALHTTLDEASKTKAVLSLIDLSAVRASIITALLGLDSKKVREAAKQFDQILEELTSL